MGFIFFFCSFVWDDRIAAGTLYEQQKQRKELNFRSEQNRFFVNASCRFHLFCKRAHDGIVSVICLKTKRCSKDTTLKRHILYFEREYRQEQKGVVRAKE